MDRKEFLERRKSGIGGSDVAAIMGFSPWKTPYGVWCDKLSNEISLTETNYQYWGRKHEQGVAEWFEETNHLEVQRRNQMFNIPGTPLNANIDRYIVGKHAILECKTCDKNAGWKFGESGTDEIPDYYNLQVQHYMYVTGYHECWLVVLIGGNDPRQYSIPYNEELAKAAAEYCCDWWNKYVVPKVAPPPTINDDLTAYYKARFGAVVTASPEIEEKIRVAAELQKQLKELTEKVEALKQEIKIFCGENEAIVGLDGKPLVTWKQQKERIVTDWKAVVDSIQPPQDEIQKFTATKPGNRPLLFKVA